MNFFLSVGFMVSASFSFASGSILTKVLGNSILGEGIHPLQIAHARFLFAFIFLFLFYIFLKPKLSSKNINLHILRSFFGLLGISIWFTAVLFIPISDATAINFLNPIFAMVLAIFILNEKVNIFRWSAAIFSFLGGLLLIRPSNDFSVNPIALMCLVGALIMGFEIICIKILSGREEVFKILLINNFCASVIGLVFLPFVFTPFNIYEMIVLMAIAICFVFGQYCFLNSMKRAEASFVMPFFYSTLIFVILLDFSIFGAIPDLISISGASMIIFGGLVITFREWKLKKTHNF